MPRIATFLSIPGQERGFEQYTGVPKPRLMLSMLSLACSKALQSVHISEKASVSFFFQGLKGLIFQ